MRAGYAIAIAAAGAVLAHASVPDHPDMQTCHYHPNMFHEYGKGPENPLSDAPGIRFYTNTSDPLAVSLDGSSGAYYFRSGTATTSWYIHHQGGGWCESYDDCISRSYGGLGSSKGFPPTADLGGGYFSQDPAVNPMMYNWNSVFMKYTDGASFSGDNSTSGTAGAHGLHFRGRRILDAVIKQLLEEHGLDQATEVVISGCSAGGLATYLHADHWADALQAAKVPVKRIAALPDSGFFLDEQLVAPVPEPPVQHEGSVRGAGQVGTTVPGNYHAGLRWVYQAQNSTGGLNALCEATEANPADCIYAQVSSKHIKTPTFPLQAEYDSWQTGHVLPPNPSNDLIQQMGDNITALIKSNLLSQPQHGVYLDSCHHHCGYWGNLEIDGDVQATAFTKFFYGMTKQKVWIQGQKYPCDACCSVQH